MTRRSHAARDFLALFGATAIVYACSSNGGGEGPSDSGTTGAPNDDASSAVDAGGDATVPSGSGGSGSSSGGGVSGSSGASGSSGGSSSSGSSSGGSSEAGTNVTGPCDLYAAGGTPCVAAHSTVRALYGAYDGKLYQVTRASDGTTKDIGVLAAGGIADAAAQDTFCSGTACTISILYDQSPNGNDLTSAPGGGAAPKADVEANAAAFGLTIAGHDAYALYVNPGTGYRNDATKGIATGDQPEGEYMVASGKHYDAKCCFDYGNAETNDKDNGAGHMEAVYFGSAPAHDSGAGPWVAADLENGLYAGTAHGVGADDPDRAVDFVTAMVKGKAGTFAVESGNAQSGKLTVVYEGARPAGYDPMLKEGAIILGIGGDNSDGSSGTFFEGCMTSGFPSDATDQAVQANIVAAGYGN